MNNQLLKSVALLACVGALQLFGMLGISFTTKML